MPDDDFNGFDIWVEFNDIDDDGHVTSAPDLARDGAVLTVGAQIIAGDHEGNRCPATVVGTGVNGMTITLKLDLERFQPSA
jgi:hypothetical protein